MALHGACEKEVFLDAPQSIARRIAGENACPPEDVGSAPAYDEFLEAINDPRQAVHKELKKWIGGKFDPPVFHIADVNARLNQPSE